ncbi:hypothetical protein [Tenacibaculum maritimum]|uniref:hypothetical protein n=1 Tax=Tenacibaculum maritimum TaxID=107401 RepID=UPI003890D0C3
MFNHLEIFEQINKRYVLLKKGWHYNIIDKKTNSIVIINDPIINYKKFINKLISKKIEIYNNIKELPSSEFENNIIDLKAYMKESKLDSEKKITLNTVIRKIYDSKNKETGVIISAIPIKAINLEIKKEIEKKLKLYVTSKIYPHTGLKIYSEIYNDSISMTFIKGINDLEQEILPGIEELTIIDWDKYLK